MITTAIDFNNNLYYTVTLLCALFRISHLRIVINFNLYILNSVLCLIYILLLLILIFGSNCTVYKTRGRVYIVIFLS